MKKSIIFFMTVIFVLLVLGGCKGTGSIKKSNLNLEKVFEELDNNILEEAMEFEVLQDDKFDEQSLKSYYNLSFEEVKSYRLKVSVLPYHINEIAIFQVEEGKEQIVKDAIQQRLERKREEVKAFPQQQKKLDDYVCEQLNDYLLFVTGHVKESVLQYISSL